MNYIEFKTKILRYFKDLPDSRINQSNAYYKKNCGSCVGAHLSYLFKIKNKYYKEDYLKGKSFFYKKLYDYLNLERQEVIDFFHKANGNGKGIFMFDDQDWSDDPYYIFRKMFYLMDGIKPRYLKDPHCINMPEDNVPDQGKCYNCGLIEKPMRVEDGFTYCDLCDSHGFRSGNE